MNKRQFFSKHLNVEGSGLEIGPGYGPFFPKKEGYHVKTLDYASGEELRQKYSADAAVDTSKIEEVDFLWSGESYSDLIGSEKFDWVFASHVIEHVPDIINFINDSASVLKTNGVLALAIPDKRYTFDMYRPQSSLGAIIDSHISQNKTPTLGNKVDYHFYYSDHKGLTSILEKVLLSRIPQTNVQDVFDHINSHSGYMDVHVWSFTPSDFRIIIEALYQANYTSLREKYFYPTVGNEFFILLSSDGAGPDVNNDVLFKRALSESRHRWGYGGRSTQLLRNIIIAIDSRYFGNRLRRIYKKYSASIHK